MQITNKTPQFDFSKDITNTYVVNYGEVKQHQDLTVNLSFTGEILEKVELLTTCGCSVANAEKSPGKENTWQGSVRYKAETTGTFSKVIVVNYKENSKNVQTRIKLKGNVTAI